MGSVELDVAAINFFGEDDGVAVVGLGDKGDAFDGLKVCGPCKADTHAAPGIGAVGDVVCTVEWVKTWVLYAEGFVLGKGFFRLRGHKWLRPRRKVKPIVRFGDADDRSARIQMRAKEHVVSAIVFCNACIVDSFDFVRDVLFSKDRIPRVTFYNWLIHNLFPLIISYRHLYRLTLRLFASR